MSNGRVASFAVPLSVTLLLAPMYPAASLAYGCGGEVSGHCAGSAAWNGYTDGMAGTISVAAISSGGDRLQNTVWFEDARSTTCRQNGYGQCRIEAGYVVGITYRAGYLGSPAYFRADRRPGYAYAEHVLDPVPQGDFGRTVDVVIDLRPPPGTWYVGIFGPGFDSDYSPGPWFSTSNTMSPGLDRPVHARLQRAGRGGVRERARLRRGPD
jgi:hypothetical protein